MFLVLAVSSQGQRLRAPVVMACPVEVSAWVNGQNRLCLVVFSWLPERHHAGHLSVPYLSFLTCVREQYPHTLPLMNIIKYYL